MTHEHPAPPPDQLTLQDCWDGFGQFLRTIETLFGDLFDAPALIARTATRRVEAWLRDGEAVARALLLAMAVKLGATMEVALHPSRAATKRNVPQAKAQWRFGFAARLSRAGKSGIRYKLSPEQKQHIDDARREARYQRRMFGGDPATTRTSAQPASRGAPFTLLPPRAPASRFVDRAGVVRRYNGLIHVMQDRERFARRLARRLAHNRASAIARALARPARKPGARPSPGDWLVTASQAHAPPPQPDTS